jgi:hypothetical protein
MWWRVAGGGRLPLSWWPGRKLSSWETSKAQFIQTGLFTLLRIVSAAPWTGRPPVELDNAELSVELSRTGIMGSADKQVRAEKPAFLPLISRLTEGCHW